MGHNEVRAKLLLLSPAFMDGAGGAELRIPSIRGPMRFWLRAVAGGKTDDLQAIAGAETAVFGGMRGKNGPTSGVSMRQIGQWPTGRPNDPDLQRDDNGAKYLAYGRIRVKRPKIGGHVPAGAAFEVAVATPQSRDPDAKLIAAAAHCLWACSVFGGLGGRSRRGYGAFAITELTGTTASGKPMTLPDLPWTSSENDLPLTISDGLSSTRDQLQGLLLTQKPGLPVNELCAASVSHLPIEPRVCLSRGPIAVQDDTGWKRALNAVGDSMMSWLNGELPGMGSGLAARLPAQANEIKGWLKGGSAPTAYDDLTFGLPRKFFSKSATEYYLSNDFDINGDFDAVHREIKKRRRERNTAGATDLKRKLDYAQSKAETMFNPAASGNAKIERRASPLAVSLVGCNGAEEGKRLKIILTALAGEFLPPGTKIAAQRRVDDTTAVLPAPDDATVTDLITTFLTDLDAKPVFGGSDK